MLAGDDDRAFWNILQPAKLVLKAADDLEPPQGGAAPLAAQLQRRLPREQQRRQPESHPKGQIDVIDDLKHQGAQEEHEAGSFCRGGDAFYGAGPGDNKRGRLEPSG